MRVWFPAALTVCATGAGVLAGINPWLGLAPWALAVLLAIARLTLRPRAEAFRVGLDPGPDSWGGRAVVLLAGSVVASAFLTRVVDGAVQRVDRTGERYLVATGGVGNTIGLVLVAAAAVCAAIALNRGTFRVGSWYSRWMLALIGWWLACTLVLRLEWAGIWVWTESAAAALLAAGMVASPPTRRTLLNLTHLLNLAVVSLLAYGLANPGQQLPCRADKCGVFDSLFVGYLFQENAAARLVVLLLPVAWVVPSRLYLVATLLGSGVFVAATGSRTSYLTYVLAAAAVLALRWAHRHGHRDSVRVSRWFRAVPLGFFLASLFVFLFVPASALTNRGAIYQGIRERLDGWALAVGSGPDTVDGLRLGFRPVGEHGQASHLLVYAGLPAVVLFAAALAAFLLGRRWSLMQVSGFVLILVASTQFATEVALPLDARSVPYAILLLSIGLFAGTHQAAGQLPDAHAVLEGAIQRSVWPPARPAHPRIAQGSRGGRPGR